MYILFHIFHYSLSQNIEYRPLCYTVALCLSILYTIVCTANPKLLIHPSPRPPAPLATTSLLPMSVTLFHK